MELFYLLVGYSNWIKYQWKLKTLLNNIMNLLGYLDCVQVSMYRSLSVKCITRLCYKILPTNIQDTVLWLCQQKDYVTI